jgi:TRAP-type uncharacterized transport system substrate-binding protein
MILRYCRVLTAIISFALFVIPAHAAPVSTPAHTAPFGTADEAVAMVKRVQARFQRDGAERTFAAVTAQDPAFRDRDLYVYIMNFDCVIQAHAARKELVGKSLWDFRDQDGIYPARNTVETARTRGSGWIDYRWTNPKTGQVEAKSTYVEKLGDRYAIGVGIYKDEQINKNTVSIISGNPGSDATSLQAAYDLASVLNSGPALRVLPVVGMGGPQNIRDVRNLKGIDIGMTQTSILNNYRRANELLGFIDDKIVYVTKLFTLEIHLVARDNINSIEDLKGQTVNFDELGSGTNYTMRDVFKRLGINVQEVDLPQAQALEKMRKGEVAATALVAGKPSQSMTLLSKADGLKFLPIPYTSVLNSDFLPSEFTSEDYPTMVPAGQKVATIADTAVLVAYKWPRDSERYKRVETFVNAFFPRIAEFSEPPHHPKWREVNLAATLQGWERLEPAQAWLDVNTARASASDAQAKSIAPSPAAQTTAARPLNDEDQRLFQEFLKWRAQRARPPR